MAINLTEKGEEVGGFLTALKDPLSDFLLAIGFVGAILALIVAIVVVIIRSVGGVSVGALMKHH